MVEPQIKSEQCRFYLSCGTTNQLFTLARILEGASEFAQQVCLGSVDLEKAYEDELKPQIQTEIRGKFFIVMNFVLVSLSGDQWVDSQLHMSSSVLNPAEHHCITISHFTAP